MTKRISKKNGQPKTIWNPRGAGRPTLTAFESFIKHVVINPDTSCWEWTGHLNDKGYAHWRTKGQSKPYRWSYEYFVTPIPEGHDVHHKCGNKKCVNPEHLEAVDDYQHYLRTLIMGQARETVQRAKTHCPHGHPYSIENTYFCRSASGGIARQCKTCVKARDAAKSKKQRQLVLV